MILILAAGFSLIVVMLVLLNVVEGRSKNAQPAQVPGWTEGAEGYMDALLPAEETSSQPDGDYAGATVDAASYTIK